jgi:hypothetical protein
VTRLSCINNNYNNNGKEVGLLAEVDITTWQVGETEASQWGCDQSGRRQSGDQRECIEIDTTTIRRNRVSENSKTVSTKECLKEC